MKKTTIARKVTVNAQSQKVWEALADFGSVSRLSPNIIKSFKTSEQTGGVGATRHCDFAAMGAQVEERIVEWNEGESMKIDIYESKNMPSAPFIPYSKTPIMIVFSPSGVNANSAFILVINGMFLLS